MLAELLFGQRVLRMRGQPRIVHRGYLRSLRLQELGSGQRILAGSLDAQMRGREAPLGQPALERAARQAPRRNYGWHALPNVFAASEETEDYVAVTVERLREAFHHQIGTQLKRSA